jgi:hypothetical protein
MRWECVRQRQCQHTRLKRISQVAVGTDGVCVGVLLVVCLLFVQLEVCARPRGAVVEKVAPRMCWWWRWDILPFMRV